MIVNLAGKEVRLPEFLIIGSARSGTTSLYYYLSQHPQIFMPKKKEPHFFSNRYVNINKEKIWSLEKYARLFKTAKINQTIGEASVSYLYKHEIAIKSIKSTYREKYKELKIIAILRNPVDRAFSHYIQLVKKGKETLSFKKAIDPQVIKNRVTELGAYDYIGNGMYYNLIKAYLKEFRFVKIYFYEDLQAPKDLTRNLFEFLGVDSSVEIDTNVKANPSGIPKSKFLANLLIKKSKFIKYFIPQGYRFKIIGYRDNLLRKTLYKPEMDLETRKKLMDIYKNDILELQKLLNRDLSHWLEVK